jgi:AcrR family transcriptional regulator
MPFSAASVDPRPARRQAKFDNILSVAWSIAAEQGLAALSLHEVARRVGLRQPSLYAYIESKSALYDAMFSQAAKSLLDHVKSWSYSADPRQAVRDSCLALFDFVVEHPVEGLLIFERTIPGFEPSAAAYGYAQDYVKFTINLLAKAGVKDQGHVDLFIAMVGGLINQQQTNEPGGDRWTRHLEAVLEMLFAYVDGRIQGPKDAPAAKGSS